MSSDYLLFEKDKEKRIAWITFNRPEKANMMKLEDMQQFPSLLRQIEEDDDVKVVIFRGAGEHFGTGADVKALGPDTAGFTPDPKAARPTIRKRLLSYRRTHHDAIDGWGMNGLYHFVKPSIAQVQGYCYGGHFQIASACDMVVASEEALFTHPAFRYIAEAHQMLPWIDMMGIKRATEMMLTGRAFTAQEMEQYGLVNRVVSRDKLEGEVNELASVVALQALDSLVVSKHFLETIKALKNWFLTSNLIASLTYCAGSYMKIEPGDLSILKEVTQKGPDGAIRAVQDRYDAQYPPKYRLTYKGRAAKE